jgi:hypothetical protein
MRVPRLKQRWSDAVQFYAEIKISINDLHPSYSSEMGNSVEIEAGIRIFGLTCSIMHGFAPF